MNKVVLMGRLTMLLDMIKETFRDNTKSENEFIELYSNVDMIIIDDLGTEKISQWALEKLYTIIENRNEKYHYDNGLSSFCEYLNEGKEALHKVLCFDSSKERINVSVSMQYTDSYNENIISFVNNVKTTETKLTNVNAQL